MMTLLNKRHDYGLDLFLLSVDEGITGYRDDSLEVRLQFTALGDRSPSSQTVKRNRTQYEVPLQIVSYQELYGWTMDSIVKQIGLKNNCKHWNQNSMSPAATSSQALSAGSSVDKPWIVERSCARPIK